MLGNKTQPIEKWFFRRLNKYLEPLIRAGAGSPGISPFGAVILETIGRKSGRTYRTPVLASEVGDLLLISTVRSRSQWIKNLAANPHTTVWLRGQSVPTEAHVIGPGVSGSTVPEAGSSLVRFLIGRLRPFSKVTGASFAILEKQARPQLAGNPNVAAQA